MKTSPYLLTKRTQKWVTDSDLMLWQRSEMLNAKFRYICGTILFRFEVRQKLLDWHRLAETRKLLRFLNTQNSFKRWVKLHYRRRVVSPALESMATLLQKLQVGLAFRRLQKYSDRLYRNFNLISGHVVKRQRRRVFQRWCRIYLAEKSRSDDMMPHEVDQIRLIRLRRLFQEWRRRLMTNSRLVKLVSLFDSFTLKMAMRKWRDTETEVMPNMRGTIASARKSLELETPLRSSSIGDISIISAGLPSPGACDCIKRICRGGHCACSKRTHFERRMANCSAELTMVSSRGSFLKSVLDLEDSMSTPTARSTAAATAATTPIAVAASRTTPVANRSRAVRPTPNSGGGRGGGGGGGRGGGVPLVPRRTATQTPARAGLSARKQDTTASTYSHQRNTSLAATTTPPPATASSNTLQPSTPVAAGNYYSPSTRKSAARASTGTSTRPGFSNGGGTIPRPRKSFSRLSDLAEDAVMSLNMSGSMIYSPRTAIQTVLRDSAVDRSFDVLLSGSISHWNNDI